MRKYFVILVLALCSVGMLKGQTVSDSLAIVSAKWEIAHSQKGIIHKSASVSQLYQSPQVINLLEIDPTKGMKIGIAISDRMKKTSRIASEHHALAAINGSYFDMRRGNSVCFLKVGRQVIDTTSVSELKQRVTGAIYERKGRMKLIPWNRQIEKKYKGKSGTILASGPLLLKGGQACGWSLCETEFICTKHPRSAIGITKDGKILFVTVDGRFPGRAGGVSIPELAHLVRILGAEDALNLDGGGSVTLWLCTAPDGGVINYPSDNKRFDHAGEREVPNIIYVYE